MNLSDDEKQIFAESLRPTSPSPFARALFQLQFAAGSTEVTPEVLPEIRNFLKEIYEPRAVRALARHPVSVQKITIAERPAIQIKPSAGPEPEKTLLYFYGGGHITGYPEQDLSITAALADYAQISVIAPEYRLAPEHPYPDAVEDALSVYQELLKTVPASSLMVAGESAGGNLTLALVHRLKSLCMPLPAKMALLSPWCDLRPENPYGGEPQDFDPTINMGNLFRAAKFYTGNHDPSHPEISPVFGRFEPPYPETMITTGSRDRLLFDCLRLVTTMRASGLSPRLEIWPDMGHVFEFYDELPEADSSLREIADFLSTPPRP